jgi:hypothetical protein
VIPDIGNPFGGPGSSLLVEPSVLGFGVQDVEITDGDRSVDFRSVFEVDAYGDFYVRDWSSSNDHVFVSLDVLDDAFGEQEIVLTLDEGDTLSAVFDVQ